MKPAFFIAVVMALTPTTGAIASDAQLPVSVVEHERLQIRGVSAEAVSTGIEVSGWVRRDNSSYGPVSAHIHIEALAANGETLRTIETQWQGELPSALRYRRPAPFRALLEGDTAIASVRVSIAAGPRHRSPSPLAIITAKDAHLVQS
jgi:hypothetical protein